MAESQPARAFAPRGAQGAAPHPNALAPSFTRPRSRPYAAPYPAWRADLDRNEFAKETAGLAARLYGNVEGLALGAVDTVKDAVETGQFVARLLDPDDARRHPTAESARDQLASAVKTGAEYIRRRAADPDLLAQDAQSVVNHLYRSTSPAATPVAATLEGEIRRSHAIGVNQGKLVFDVATAVSPRIALKATRGARALAHAKELAKYQARGEPLDIAEYLASPYTGRGSHFISRKTGQDWGIPEWLIDSPINVRKGETFGQNHDVHYQYDRQFHGAKLPRGLSRKGWSGKRAGLQRYGPVERLWKGAPDALKGAAAGAAALGYDTLGQRAYDED